MKTTPVVLAIVLLACFAAEADEATDASCVAVAVSRLPVAGFRALSSTWHPPGQICQKSGNPRPLGVARRNLCFYMQH